MKQVWVRLTALVLMGHPSQSFLGVKPAPVRTCLYCEEAEPVSAGSGYQGSRRKRRGGAGVKKSSNPNVRKEVAEIRENAIAQPKGVGGLFQVPVDSRDKSQPDPIPSHVKFYSLENLFPEAPGECKSCLFDWVVLLRFHFYGRSIRPPPIFRSCGHVRF